MGQEVPRYIRWLQVMVLKGALVARSFAGQPSRLRPSWIQLLSRIVACVRYMKRSCRCADSFYRFGTLEAWRDIRQGILEISQAMCVVLRVSYFRVRLLNTEDLQAWVEFGEAEEIEDILGEASHNKDSMLSTIQCVFTARSSTHGTQKPFHSL